MDKLRQQRAGRPFPKVGPVSGTRYSDGLEWPVSDGPKRVISARSHFIEDSPWKELEVEMKTKASYFWSHAMTLMKRSFGVAFFLCGFLVVVAQTDSGPSSEIDRQVQSAAGLFEKGRTADSKKIYQALLVELCNRIGTIYNWAQFEGLVTTNPAAGWRLEDVGSEYVPVIVNPEQVKQIIMLLPNPMHQMLVLACASTAVRASEACGLKWCDINWEQNQINIQRRWTAACIDKPKTKASKGPVAMSPQLAWYLRQWRRMTPYAKDDDWVFPSFKMNGKIPMCAGIFVTDRLRPAALKAGIQIAQGSVSGFTLCAQAWLLGWSRSTRPM